MATCGTAFISGGTGFLGSFLMSFLLRRGRRVLALGRGPKLEGRLLEALHGIGEGEGESFMRDGRLAVVEGDVRLPGLGLRDEQQNALAAEVDEIWHCAASFKFHERSREEVTAHNITGTRNVLEFARFCNLQRETQMFHVSTAYAAPLIDGLVREELPASDAPFRNRYEWSKQEAERIVGEFRRQYHLPVCIFRPSIILGHSRTGRATRFTGYYDVVRAVYLLTRSLEINLGAHFDRDLHLRIVAGAEARLDVVPVDFVVEAMWRIARGERREAWIFNLTNDHPPLLAFLFEQACASLSVTGIELVDTSAFQHQPMSGLERLFNRRTQFQAPYLLDGPLFDNSNFRALVSEAVLPCPRADESLLRRVNEYYYRDVLDRQFGVRQPGVLPPSNESPLHVAYADTDEALWQAHS